MGGRESCAKALAARCAAILFALAAFSCAPRSEPTHAPSPPALAPAPEHTFPGSTWSQVSAESAGYSSHGLTAVRAYVRQLDTTGLLVVAGGRVLLEEGDTREVTYLASARKSVLAMLYGPAIARGTIRLEATLAELGIDDAGGLWPEEKQATIGDLLTARSGVFHPASNPGDDLKHAPPRRSQKPGSYFLYSNWDFNVLGSIFEQKTGRSIYAALEKELAVPIGMEDFRRDAQRKSGDAGLSIHRAYYMSLSTRDMARLGYLMLREGNWAGRQVIPREWVRRLTRRAVPVEEMHPPSARRWGLSYGLLWWLFDDAQARSGGALAGAYSAWGAFGQYITVIPKLDLVIAHKTRPEKPRSVSMEQYRRLLELLVQARARARASASPLRPPG